MASPLRPCAAGLRVILPPRTAEPLFHLIRSALNVKILPCFAWINLPQVPSRLPRGYWNDPINKREALTKIGQDLGVSQVNKFRLTLVLSLTCKCSCQIGTESLANKSRKKGGGACSFSTHHWQISWRPVIQILYGSNQSFARKVQHPMAIGIMQKWRENGWIRLDLNWASKR